MPTKKVETPRFTVLRDTSEHDGHGWVFEGSEACAGTVARNLYTGDYSLEGYYDDKTFVIERKGAVSELAGNLTQKEKWDDFRQELERLEEFRFPFLVLEFPLSLLMSYPKGSGIPASRWGSIRIKPQFLLKRLLELEVQFRTRIIFAGNHGRDVALGLFKRIVEHVPRP